MSSAQPDDFVAFDIEVQPRRDVVAVSPRGEVDLATVGQLRARIDELTAAGFKRVLLDLRETTFIDSTGLRLLLELARDSGDDGWDLALIDGPAPVQRLFDVTGVRRALPFTDARAPRWNGKA